MKLLVLTRYSRMGASSRLRVLQYLPRLQARGVQLEVAPFFDDAYLQALYAGQRSSVGRYYLDRIRRLIGQHRPDAIWQEKETLPWLPWWFEQRVLPRGVPVISEYDDAVFHRYDMHRNAMVRRMLGQKLDRVMAGSALVMAGNPYLADRARRAGAARVEIVPTVVDAEAYETRHLPDPDGMPKIGWIGSPSTWTGYLQPMLPMLAGLAQQKGARIRVVGAGVPSTAVLESLPWSEAEESRMIQGMDIGLMPLDDTPWSRGKCGYKLIQYMACGLPVVASPVGVNAEIVQHGVTGFLAETETEWREAIGRLLADPDLRHRMGAAGRKRMEERYSLQIWGPRVADLVLSVLRG